jgi:hypothetical protein
MKAQLGTKEFNDSAMEMFGGKPKQQTAVEFLEEQLFLNRKPTLNELLIIKEAKEMEKEQMINFANDLLARNNKNYIALPDLAEEYYNETFNK